MDARPCPVAVIGVRPVRDTPIASRLLRYTALIARCRDRPAGPATQTGGSLAAGIGQAVQGLASNERDGTATRRRRHSKGLCIQPIAPATLRLSYSRSGQSAHHVQRQPSRDGRCRNRRTSLHPFRDQCHDASANRFREHGPCGGQTGQFRGFAVVCVLCVSSGV